MQHLATLERLIRERLPAQAGVAIVRHALGNPCEVEYVHEVRRLLEGRIIGVKIRPRGGTAPTMLQMAPDSPEIRFVREGSQVHYAQLEPRDEVSLLVATQGLGRYLPAVFTRGIQRDVRGPSQADFLRRYLLLFQTMSHATESRVAGRNTIMDPVRMDPKFLPWLASWLDFTLDERIPVTRRRIFLRRAVELFRWRGTTHGIREMIKTLTGLDTNIGARRGPQPMELGNCALSRPEEDEDPSLAESGERALGTLPYVTHAGEHLLTSPRFSREEYFTIVLGNRGELVSRYRDRLAELLEQVARIAQHERPAHLDFVICFKDEEVTHNGLVLCDPSALSPNAALGRACLLA